MKTILLERFLLSALLLVVWPTVVVIAQVDPCVDNIDWGNPKRSTAYAYDSSIESPLCDFSLDESRWYRFPSYAGSEIPELPTPEIPVPAFYTSCGTHIPIYISARADESYHDQAKRTRPLNVFAPVCGVYGMSDCDWKSQITIHYCDNLDPDKTFFVYNLKRPEGCSAAYCVGTGAASAPVPYPIMTFPTLSGPKMIGPERIPNCPPEKTVKRFAFYCNVGYEVTNDQAEFEVKLLFNGIVSDITLKGSGLNLAVEIDELLLRGNLGKALSCQVTAYWRDTEGIRSPPLLSVNDYWAGITGPGTLEVDLDRLSPFEIDIMSTVPITCWYCYEAVAGQCPICNSLCSYTFTVGQTDHDFQTSCELKMSNEAIDTANGEISEFVAGKLVFDVETAPGLASKNGGRHLITFEPFPNIPGFGERVLWKDYRIPDIAVSQEQKTARPLFCQAYTDPHYVTVMGRSGYGVFRLGDFVLARFDDKDNKLYMDIQTRLFSCSVGSCNCGVIVREGNAILGVDACTDSGDGFNGNNIRLIRYLESRDQNGGVIPDGSSIYRDATGTRYTIEMASGLTVLVKIYKGSAYPMDLDVTLPTRYTADKIFGICNWKSDATEETYKVRNDDSMFVNKNIQCMDWPTIPAVECYCRGVPPDHITLCSSLPIGADTTAEVLLTNQACVLVPVAGRLQMSSSAILFNDTSRGDDTISLDDAFILIDYDENHGKDLNFDWPTAGGKTEQQAEDQCRTSLKSSPAYGKCQEKFDEERLVEDCKTDIQLLDDFSVADQYAQILEDSCLHEVIAESNATSKEDLENDPNYSEIHDLLCPEQCSNAGICVKGNCICNAGYAGPDCGTDSSLPPIFLAFQYGGLCELVTKNCAKFRVSATNVYDSPNLSCRFTSYPLLGVSSRLYKAEVIVSRGVFVTPREIVCYLPSSRVGLSSGYHVAMSNDGFLFGEEHNFLVYNPKCLEFVSGVWSQRENTCFSDELCYSSGQRQNEEDNCLICEPQNEWIDSAGWGAWGDCSRACDMGLQQRDYGCTGVTLQSETQLCITQECIPNPEEKNEGVFILIFNNDIKKLLGDTDLFFGTIAQAINSYCSEHTDECCSQSTARQVTGRSVTSRDQCTFGTGTPIAYFNDYRVKVIAMRYSADIADQCSMKSAASADDDQVYVNKVVIYNAIIASLRHIEDVLGYQIAGIERPS